MKWPAEALLHSTHIKAFSLQGGRTLIIAPGETCGWLKGCLFFVHTSSFTVSKVFSYWGSRLWITPKQMQPTSTLFSWANKNPKLNRPIKNKANELVRSNHSFITDLWITARLGTLMDPHQCWGVSSFLQTRHLFHSGMRKYTTH